MSDQIELNISKLRNLKKNSKFHFGCKEHLVAIQINLDLDLDSEKFGVDLDLIFFIFSESRATSRSRSYYLSLDLDLVFPSFLMFGALLPVVNSTSLA